jgi:hypothetical protein
MSEEQKPESVLKNVEVLKRDVKIKLDLPVAYHTRLNQFIMEMFPVKDQKEFAELLDRVIKDETQEDRKAYHLHTLISLVTIIEDSAREQGFTEKVNYDMETGEYSKPSTEENQSSPQ